MENNKKSLTIGIAAALFALTADQATKALVVAKAAALSSGVAVVPGFNLVFFRNDGVTFGLLGGAPWWSLVAVALAVCVWLAVLMVRTPSRVEALAYGTIIGGAAGNIVDRLRHRAVTDFLDVYIGAAHWPAFNLADVFVVSGVALLFAAPWLSGRAQA